MILLHSSVFTGHQQKFQSTSELLQSIRCEIGKRLGILTRLQVRISCAQFFVLNQLLIMLIIFKPLNGGFMAW